MYINKQYSNIEKSFVCCIIWGSLLVIMSENKNYDNYSGVVNVTERKSMFSVFLFHTFIPKRKQMHLTYIK
jgi:membrane protein CcdC involved in cytochrome C biogenesis